MDKAKKLCFLTLIAVITSIMIFLYHQISGMRVQMLIVLFLCYIGLGLIAFNKIKLSFVIYLIIIFIVMFVRSSVEDNVNDKDYLERWLMLLFTNKTVFVNVIGNTLLFIPLIIYLIFFTKKAFLSFSLALLIIVSLEVLQYVTRRGVFDYIDILLNTTGITVAIVFITIYYQIKGVKDGKEKERKQ